MYENPRGGTTPSSSADAHDNSNQPEKFEDYHPSFIYCKIIQLHYVLIRD